MPENPSYEELKQRVSELKQQNELLQSEATKYRTLFDSFPHGITVSDAHGNIVEANSISEQLLGISKEEHKKRAIDGEEWRIIRKDGTDMPPDEWASVIALKERRMVTDSEMGIVKSDGQTTWINVTAAPLQIEGYGVVITYSDITKNMQAEAMLRKSEAQKRAILDSSLDSIRLVDKNMRIIWTNKLIETQLQKERNKIIGDYCYHVYTGRSEPCPNCPTQKALKSGKTEHSIIIEENVKGIEGKSYWADYAVPITNESEEIVNFLQVSRNITDLKKAELALLEEKNKLALALARVKKLSGMLPICSHCKKIRDDKGYWNQIESYIHEHSEAEFSHGICQECADKYYPDMALYNDDDS